MKINLTPLIFLIGSQIIHAQKIIKHQNVRFDTIHGDYSYTGIPYKYENMDAIFSQDDLAYATYKYSKKKLRTGKFLGVISVSSLSLGLLSIIGSQDEGYVSNWEGLLAGSALVFSALGTGIPALICHGRGKHLERKAIDQFNNSQTIGWIDVHQAYWSYGVTTNGVGFTYNF